MNDEIEGYLNSLIARGRSPRTIDAYRMFLGYFAAYAYRMRVKRLRDVNLTLIGSYRRSLIKRGLSVGSQRSYLAVVRRFLAWASRQELLLADVGSRMELPRADHTLPPTPLTREEVGRMMSLSSRVTVGGLRNRALLELFYGCGLRREEITKLNIEDLDFAEGRLFVRGKGSKDRVLPVNPPALQSVREYLEKRGGRCKGKDPLFVVQESLAPRRINGAYVSNLCQWLSRRMGRHLHPHLLRHTFAVHLLQNGIHLSHLQLLLGHENLDTTSRYLGLVKSEIRAEYDRAMEWIGAGRGEE